MCVLICVNVFVSSLEGRFEDEELQQILDDIQTKRSFQYWDRIHDKDWDCPLGSLTPGSPAGLDSQSCSDPPQALVLSTVLFYIQEDWTELVVWSESDVDPGDSDRTVFDEDLDRVGLMFTVQLIIPSTLTINFDLFFLHNWFCCFCQTTPGLGLSRFLSVSIPDSTPSELRFVSG